MHNFAHKRRMLVIFRFMMAFYQPRVYRPLLAAATFFALVSCTNSDDSTDNAPAGETPSISDHLSVKAAPETSQVEFQVQVAAGINAIQLVAASESRRLRLLSFKNSAGDALFDSKSVIDTTHSDAGTMQNSPLTYNYPLLAADAPLTAGTYTATYEITPLDASLADDGTADEEDTRGDVTLSIITKSDGDLSSGTVNVNVVLSGTVANSKDSKEAVESAMEIAGQILQRYDILLHVNILEVFELPEVLPNPFDGDVLYEELAMVTDEGINIYFVSDVDAPVPSAYSSATAGSSPGPVLPSFRSAIAVSISEAAGGDGIFDKSGDEDDDRDSIEDSETRLLAESVAHELLRYLGLHDTLTFGGSGVLKSDGLDSEKCSNIDACEDNKGANGNVMFPFALEDDNADEEEYFPRDRLSPMQVELVQRSVALD